MTRKKLTNFWSPWMTKALEILTGYQGPPIRIMEVCGTHTHEIFRQGIRPLLPEAIRLISGPGCPVCVTPTSYIDEAVWLALEKSCTITSFGDLVRVPGTKLSLAGARARGGKVQPVYSPLDALEYAKNYPGEEVVFLSVGFETTTPASLLAVSQARDQGVDNFSLLVANKTMDNAYRALKDSADVFLYPGHVAAITGTKIFHDLLEEGVSGVVTGFTGPELMAALAIIAKKSEEGTTPFFVNAYPRVVTDQGSRPGQKIIKETTDPIDTEWRGLGVIPQSGLKLKPEFAPWDAKLKYGIPDMEGEENPACHCGEVLKGEISPQECPVFAKACTPDQPVGACMVSSEGACAAFYKYGAGLDGLGK